MTFAEQPQRMIYGRRQAPKLKLAHKHLLETLLPQISIPLPKVIQPTPKSELGLPVKGPLWLEIGFGSGEHLGAVAAANPGVTCIGIEPYVTGVAKLLDEIDKKGLSNIRIMSDDARLLLRSLPDQSLDRAFILYPDPWPKLRHHKRRIINDQTIGELARLLKPQAELRIATDHADYRRWILAVMRRSSNFGWMAERSQDWRERPVDQIATRYEGKALSAGRQPVYLRYQRVK